MTSDNWRNKFSLPLLKSLISIFSINYNNFRFSSHFSRSLFLNPHLPFLLSCHFSWFFQHFCFEVVVSQPFSYQWALLEEVGEVTRGFLRLSINGQNLCQHYLYNIYQHLGSKLFFNVLAISYIFSVFNFNWFFYLAFIGDKTDISVELTRVTRGWEEIMLLKKPPTLDTSGSTVITLPSSFLHHSNEIKFN